MRFIFYLIIATFLSICLLPFQPYNTFILLVIILATLFYIASIVNDIYSEIIQSKESNIKSHQPTMNEKEKDASHR